MLAALFRVKQLCAFHVNAPLLAGDGVGRASVIAKGAVAAHRLWLLGRLGEGAVGEHRSQPHPRTVDIVQKQSAFANGA